MSAVKDWRDYQNQCYVIDRRERRSFSRLILFVTIGLAIVLLGLLLPACMTEKNSLYCDAMTPCTSIDRPFCDLVAHECGVAGSDLASTEIVDMAQVEARDISVRDDLSPQLDLEKSDLETPPDLYQPPDLTPPTPYFVPDVQTILNVGGCAATSCHNAGQSLYVPFLVPSPAPGLGTAEHANFTNFSAESMVTVLSKLDKTSGTAHGGTMTSPDRKPCATSGAEPCATLSRWYTAGAGEAKP